MSNPAGNDQPQSETEKQALSSTVIRGGKWLGIAALAQAVLQIAIVAILARLLSPAEFGLAAVAGIFIDLAAGIAAMGASQALIQRRELTDHHIRAAFWVSMIMGLSVSILLFLTSNRLASVLGSPAAGPLIAALSVVFVIRALGSVPEGLAARRLNFRLLAVRKLVAYVLGYSAVGIISAFMGAGPWALVYAQIAQVTLETFLLVVAIRFDCRPTFDRSAYRDILGYGSGFSAASIVNSLANQADRVIVSMGSTTTAVGLYTRAVQITRYPHRLIGQVIEDVLFPSFSGVQTNRERLTGAYYRSLGSIFVVMTPVTVFFCITALPITNILLGAQWTAAVPLIAAFGISIPFRSAQRVSSALLRAVGRSWLIAALQVLFLVTTTAGALIGIQFGLLGAAIGVTAAFILHYLVVAYASLKILSLNFSKLFTCHFVGIPLGIVSAGCGAIGLLLSEAFPAAISLLLALVMLIISSLAAMVASPRFFLRDDGRWVCSLLLSKLPRRCRANKVTRALEKRIAE